MAKFSYAKLYIYPQTQHKTFESVSKVAEFLFEWNTPLDSAIKFFTLHFREYFSQQQQQQQQAAATTTTAGTDTTITSSY